jgi:hypothetical protein
VVLAPALGPTRPTQPIVSYRPNSLSFLKPALHDTGAASGEDHHSCELPPLMRATTAHASFVERALKATRIFAPTPETAYVPRPIADRYPWSLHSPSRVGFVHRLTNCSCQQQTTPPVPHAPQHQTSMSSTEHDPCEECRVWICRRGRRWKGRHERLG